MQPLAHDRHLPIETTAGLAVAAEPRTVLALLADPGSQGAEQLPAYAPELNPVEGLWANLKAVELANLPTTALAEVADATEQGIRRVCNSDDLVGGCLAHTRLSLDP